MSKSPGFDFKQFISLKHKDAHLQAELELLLGLHHVGALVADVLQRGGDVDLLGALRHAVQHHVDEAVGAGAAGAVTAVHHDGARAAAVGLVHLPATHTTTERRQ